MTWETLTWLGSDGTKRSREHCGSLVKNEEFYTPSQDGTLVYFTARSGDHSNELHKVEMAGGQVVLSKNMIAEDIGFMEIFIDAKPCNRGSDPRQHPVGCGIKSTNLLST